MEGVTGLGNRRRYWVIRTDRRIKPLLVEELRSGRLRQGWGYCDDQDLRLIKVRIDKGTGGEAGLSASQRDAIRNLKMLTASEGGIRPGDVVLTPNLPEEGHFFITEVAGAYRFEMLDLRNTPHDVNGVGSDYGHILPVRLLSPAKVNRYSDRVHADIRTTLRSPGRMWNADWCGEKIEQLITDIRNGVDLSPPATGRARLGAAWEAAVAHATDELRRKLEPGLTSRFRAAEWEEPIKIAVESLYPSCNVRWVGGPQENGADIIVELPNYFAEKPWLILVQIKDYSGEIGPSVVSQLLKALEHYGNDGNVICLVAMTMAERASADFYERANTASREVGVPIEVVCREKMLDLMADGLVARMGSSRTGNYFI